jgi:hypothetical protein
VSSDFLESAFRVIRFTAETNRDLQGQQSNGEINRALGEKPKTNDEFQKAALGLHAG